MLGMETNRMQTARQRLTLLASPTMT